MSGQMQIRFFLSSLERCKRRACKSWGQKLVKEGKKLRKNTHRERCLCYQSPLEYLAASSASSSHWKDLQSAERSHWSCCLARRARWCSRLAAWTPGWGTRRCWAQGTQSAPWCDPVAQSGHSPHQKPEVKHTHSYTRARSPEPPLLSFWGNYCTTRLHQSSDFVCSQVTSRNASWNNDSLEGRQLLATNPSCCGWNATAFKVLTTLTRNTVAVRRAKENNITCVKSKGEAQTCATALQAKQCPMTEMTIC